MRGIKLIVLMLCCFVTARSQSDTTLANAAGRKSLLKLGKNALVQKDPKSAIVFFETYLKKYRKKDVQAMTGLGFAYLEVRNYDKAQRTFLRAYNILKDDKSKKYTTSEVLYYHALMQKSNGLYDSAKTNFTKFKKEYKGNNKQLKKLCTKEIGFCDSVHKLVADHKKLTILRLDTTINKINTEGSPVILDDFTMVFSSLRTEKEVVVAEDTGTVLKRKLYVAHKKNGKWKFGGEFEEGINDNGFNTGNACFSPDRKRMYFTRCQPNYKDEMICAIYVTEKNGDKWSEPVKLPKNVNSPKYTSTMPAVTTDPVKGNDIIYFVSNRKGGKGGQDIWYTIYNKKNKTYREPKNAGNKINTTRNELSPYFDSETQSLYFSSDGWGGLGGYDVFKATGDGKRWISVDNIGQPINTGADELYYTISPNRREGFFVSNRKGGNTLKNATCCDDIYIYYNNEYIDVILKGNIGELLDPFDPVANASIEIYLKDAKTDEKFLVKTVYSDSKGNYTANLEPGHDYYLVAKKKDFLGTSADVTTKGITQSGKILKDLALTKNPKDAIHIPNIQYEFDRSNILESSKIALDTTVLELMNLNPELIIEIQSHTDSKGNDKYNLKLSQKRAESVVNYLVSKGISPKRLKAQGFGEAKPIAPNENKDGSDNPEGRAKNRRTDFKIIGMVDAELINEGSVDN